jgi:hypothetical protein
MATTESSAPHAHPPTEEHDDTVEAHYACLERPCACLEGWVTIGQIAVDPETREIRALPLPQVRGAKLGRREYSLGRGMLSVAPALDP